MNMFHNVFQNSVWFLDKIQETQYSSNNTNVTVEATLVVELSKNNSDFFMLVENQSVRVILML